MTSASTPASAQDGLLTASATVIEPFAGGAWVAVEPMTACEGCSAVQGCGSALLASWRGKRTQSLAISSERVLQSGERITIGLPSPTLLKGTLGVYGIPLGLSLFFGLMAEQWLTVGHVLVPLAFVVGLTVGAAIVHLFRYRNRAQYRPQWVAMHDPPGINSHPTLS